MLTIKRLTAQEIQDLIAANGRPPCPTNVVYTVVCAHTERPMMHGFGPTQVVEIGSTGAHTSPAAEGEGPSEEDRIQFIVMQHGLIVGCACVDRYWMQHGPVLTIADEQGRHRPHSTDAFISPAPLRN